MSIDEAAATVAVPGILARAPGASIAYHRRPGKRPGLVFLGGWASDMNGTKALMLDRLAAETRQSFVRFDYQGHGASSGTLAEGTIGVWRDDALAVLDELTEGPQILVGSSMGGWIMLLAALARPERIAGLIGIAAAPDFIQALIWPSLSEAGRHALMEAGEVRIPTAHDPDGYILTRRQWEEGQRHQVLDRPLPIRCPVRLLQGMQDGEVPWRHALRLVERLESRDVTLTLVAGGDHRLSAPADLDRLALTVRTLSAEVASR